MTTDITDTNEVIGEGKFEREVVGGLPFLTTTFPLAPTDDVARLVSDAKTATDVWREDVDEPECSLEVYFYDHSLTGKAAPCESGKALFMYVRLPSEEIPEGLLDAAEDLVEQLAAVFSR